MDHLQLCLLVEVPVHTDKLVAIHFAPPSPWGNPLPPKPLECSGEICHAVLMLIWVSLNRINETFGKAPLNNFEPKQYIFHLFT